MEGKGKLVRVKRDLESGKLELTFRLECRPELIDELIDKELRIRADIWRPRKTNSQNAYFWALCSEIAARLEGPATNTEIYEHLLKEYGTFMRNEDGSYKEDPMPENRIKARRGRHTMDIKGISECNIAEMSRLIDGAIYEAQELGIATDTPEELERMKVAWESQS